MDRKRNEKWIVERQRARRAKWIWVKDGIVGIQESRTIDKRTSSDLAWIVEIAVFQTGTVAADRGTRGRTRAKTERGEAKARSPARLGIIHLTPSAHSAVSVCVLARTKLGK